MIAANHSRACSHVPLAGATHVADARQADRGRQQRGEEAGVADHDAHVRIVREWREKSAADAARILAAGTQLQRHDNGWLALEDSAGALGGHAAHSRASSARSITLDPRGLEADAGIAEGGAVNSEARLARDAGDGCVWGARDWFSDSRVQGDAPGVCDVPDDGGVWGAHDCFNDSVCVCSVSECVCVCVCVCACVRVCVCMCVYT